jgi:hypothetical protein
MKYFILLCGFILAAGYAVAQFASGSAPASSGGSGTVTSVTLTGDGIVLSATPSSPVTTSGTLTAQLALAPQNSVLAGPTSGGSGVPTYQTVPQFNGAGITNQILNRFAPATCSQTIAAAPRYMFFEGMTQVGVTAATNCSVCYYGVVTFTNVLCITNIGLNVGSNYVITLMTNGNFGTGPLASSGININLGMTGVTNPILATPFSATNTVLVWAYNNPAGVSLVTEPITIKVQ